MIPCWNILLASFCSLFSHFSVKLFNSSCPHQGYHFNVLLWHLWHLGFTCCPPVASSATIMSPSHFHPATIGWSVLNHLLLLHPHIPAAFSHLTGIVPSSTVFWFHFSKTKAYCCPVSRSVCSHFQAGGKVVRQYRNCKKSGPRNSRDDSSLLAFIVLVARFSAVRSNLWFPGRHDQIFTLRKLSLAASLDLEEGAYPGQGLHVWHPHIFFTPIWSSSFSWWRQGPHPSHYGELFGYMCLTAAIWHPRLLLAHLIIPHRFLLLSFVLTLLSHKDSSWHRRDSPIWDGTFGLFPPSNAARSSWDCR